MRNEQRQEARNPELRALLETEKDPAPVQRIRRITGTSRRILAVGDDRALFRDLARYVRAEGYSFQRVSTPDAALRAIGRGDIALLVIPLTPDRARDLAWWEETLRQNPRPPRILALATQPSLLMSVTPSGAAEIVAAPVDRDRLADVLRRLREAESETTIPLLEDAEGASPSKIITRSPDMLPVFAAISHASPTTANVLIIGASGTGKELVARAIHQSGPRAHGPFVSLHAAALPEPLLERELFGHAPGAFPGANTSRAGGFERAAGGTLFLDEIGDLGPAVQERLLRAIDERVIEHVGGSEPVPIDARLIASVSRDPNEHGEGGLRPDLRERLGVVTVTIPRLAERGDDIFLLTSAFLREFGAAYGKTFSGVSTRAFEMLQNHDWAGNVRELRNVIERAAVVADGPVIRPEHLPDDWKPDPARWRESRRPRTLREVEIRHIASVLEETRGQIGEAARILGLHRNTLARKIRLYGL